MIFSALSEIFTLAAVIPFLSIINNKEEFWSNIKSSNIIENSFLNNSDDFLIFSIILFAITACLTAIVRISNIYLNTRLAGSIGSDISCQCYLNKLSQSYEYHLNSNSSELINTITYDIRMTMISINLFLQLILASLITLSILATLIIVDWQICLFSGFCFISLYLLIAFFSNSRLKSNSRIVSRQGTLQVQSMQEGLGSIRNMIMTNSQKYYISTYQNSDRPMRIAETENIALGNFPRYVLESLGLVVLSIATLILIKKEPSSISYIPLIGTFALASQRLIPSMQQVYGGWAGIVSYNESLKNIVFILNLKRTKKNHLFDIKPYNLQNHLELKSISFKYQKKTKFALRDINIKIRKGEIIGIIGKTGSGKSTLLDIIMSLLNPINGQLIVDDRPIFNDSKLKNIKNQLRIDSWRKSIAHVPQNIFLSDCSIAENIALGIDKNSIDMAKVKWSTEIAQISDFIENLKDSYSTKVGERGVLLSGGQRQRIGIARALYQEASLLILDEATSALDTTTEKKVMNAIFKNAKNITCIIVAHRLSTLAICEKVINMENGKIKEILSNTEYKKKFIFKG
jgi:ATP-binding cassette subfamily B protein